MADDLGFSIEKFQKMWGAKTEATAARQAEEVKVLGVQQKKNEDLAAIQQESLVAKQTYLEQSVRPAVKEIQTLETAAQKQRELMTEGGFMNYLKIMDLQFQNPAMYTSEGRAKMRAEINAKLSMGATLNQAQQEVFAAQMDAVNNQAALKQAKLQQLTLTEAQANEVLKAEADRVSILRQGIAASNAAKTEILDSMTVEQLKAAKDEATKTGAKDVDMSGFKISVPQLDMHINKVETLSYDAQVQRLTAEQKLTDLQLESKRRMLSSLSTNQIGTLSSGQPVEIMTRTGKLALNPSDFTPGELSQAYDFKRKLENDSIDDMLKMQTSSDIVDSTLAPQLEQMERIKANRSIVDNSPVKMRAKQRSSELTQSIQLLRKLGEKAQANPDNELIQSQYNEALHATQQRFDKAAATDAAIFEKQAKIDSRGDKNLFDMLMDNYRGTPIDSATATNAVVDRLTKNQSVDDVLPKEVAQAAQTQYKQLYAQLLKDTQFSMGDTLGKKEMQAQAAQQALNIAVTQYTQAKTDDFIGAQAMLNTQAGMWEQNPIAAVTDSGGRKIFDTPDKFLMFVKAADVEGERVFRQGNDWLDDAKIQALKMGQAVQDGDKAMTPEQFQQSLLAVQNRQLLLNLDMRRPGLADAYVKWWQESGAQYAKAHADQLMSGVASGDVQGNVVSTMSASLLDRSIQNYQFSIIDSIEDFRQERQRQRKEWVSYDLDPGNRQAALLQFDANLSDDDRVRIYQGIIAPVLEEATKMGAEYDDANIMVEEALANPESINPNLKEDPALKRALQKMNVGRADATIALEALSDSPWLYGNDKKIPDNVWGRLSPEFKQEEQVRVPGDFGQNLNSPRRIKTPFLSGTNGWLSNETGTRPYDWYRKLRSQ